MQLLVFWTLSIVVLSYVKTTFRRLDSASVLRRKPTQLRPVPVSRPTFIWGRTQSPVSLTLFLNKWW
jgi:hypothetical protein